MRVNIVTVFAVLAALAVVAGGTSAEARQKRSHAANWETSLLETSSTQRVHKAKSKRHAKRLRGEPKKTASLKRAYKKKRYARTARRLQVADNGSTPVRRYKKKRYASQVRRSYVASDTSSYGSGSSRYGAGRRPSRWCGWWMRTQRGGGPHLNVAWNWRLWGSPSGPQVGAVVVWRHHVGEIVGRATNGLWLVRSGNDGGRVRTRARSVAGALFRVG